MFEYIPAKPITKTLQELKKTSYKRIRKRYLYKIDEVIAYCIILGAIESQEDYSKAIAGYPLESKRISGYISEAVKKLSDGRSIEKVRTGLKRKSNGALGINLKSDEVKRDIKRSQPKRNYDFLIKILMEEGDNAFRKIGQYVRTYFLSEESLRKYKDFQDKQKGIADGIEIDKNAAEWLYYEDKEIERCLAQILGNSQ